MKNRIDVGDFVSVKGSKDVGRVVAVRRGLNRALVNFNGVSNEHSLTNLIIKVKANKK